MKVSQPIPEETYLDLLDEIGASPVSERRIATSSGASVGVREDETGERIEVRDAGARLLFEHDPKTGKSVLWVPDGDLAFKAAGNVDIDAGGAIRFRANDELRLEAGAGEGKTSLSLTGRMAELSSQVLKLASDSAELAFKKATLSSLELRAKVKDAHLVATRVETVTERLMEHARSVFRTIEDLHQVKAGRSRTLVERDHYLRAGNTTIEADEDVKIDGKGIHLG